MGIEGVTPPGADSPPKAERPKRKPSPGSGKLREGLEDFYVTIGAVAITPIDRLAGALMIANAPDIADQWVSLAEKDARVKRALESLVQAGGWGGVIMAHGMIMLPVLANRGMLPDQIAAGAAVMTVSQHPETLPLFTHPRFANVSGTNGSGEWGGTEDQSGGDGGTA